MKFATTAITSILLAATMAPLASADIINTDWLDYGDNLVISDSVSGLQFLKLSETAGLSVNTVKNSLSTTYSGWKFATTAEIITLNSNALSAFGGYSLESGRSSSFYTDELPVALVDLLGGNEGYRVYGFTPESGERVSLYGFQLISQVSGNNAYVTFNAFEDVSYTTDYSHISAGTWLVKDDRATSVSAPLALSGIALLGFGAIRRKRNH
jgi:hypothetical protein